jgi:hypothetical protein
MAAIGVGLFVTWLPASSARPATGTATGARRRLVSAEYAIFCGLDVGKRVPITRWR